MLLQIGILLSKDGLIERRKALVFPRSQQRRAPCARNFYLEGQRGATELRRIGGRIGKNDDWRLEALGTMDGHHSDLVRRHSRIALNFDRAAREPRKKPIERGSFAPFELESAVHELVDRIACGDAKT